MSAPGLCDHEHRWCCEDENKRGALVAPGKLGACWTLRVLGKLAVRMTPKAGTFDRVSPQLRRSSDTGSIVKEHRSLTPNGQPAARLGSLTTSLLAFTASRPSKLPRLIQKTHPSLRQSVDANGASKKYARFYSLGDRNCRSPIRGQLRLVADTIFLWDRLKCGALVAHHSRCGCGGDGGGPHLLGPPEPNLGLTLAALNWGTASVRFPPLRSEATSLRTHSSFVILRRLRIF